MFTHVKVPVKLSIIQRHSNVKTGKKVKKLHFNFVKNWK